MLVGRLDQECSNAALHVAAGVEEAFADASLRPASSSPERVSAAENAFDFPMRHCDKRWEELSCCSCSGPFPWC